MNHKARKRFGQNFLQNHQVIYDILSAINIQANEHWVEIGPGLGAITEPLLENNIHLDVIELDRDLVQLLNKKLSDHNHLTLHSADALTFDFSSLIEQSNKIRIIGNLPYNISTPLLFHLLKYANGIEDMHFMLQKEVVDRICAEPGSKKYGRLSVMIQYYYQTEWLFDVPPESFDPEPKVMSSIIRLIPHLYPPVTVDNIEKLNRIVTTAFSQRRKTIRNSLKSLLTEQQIISVDIDPQQRAESISLDGFARLANLTFTD